MSRVATAEGHTLLGSPAKLREFWSLKIEGSSLTVPLTGFEIMSQQPSHAGANINRLFGGVDTANDTILGLMDGLTVVAEHNGRPQQTVSFEIIVQGARYLFTRGVLSADGSSISGGVIDKNPLGLEPPVVVEDGTWSAQGQPGNPPDRLGKDKPRR